ncbi:MAG: sigma-54-dependent Fis family transcriptional regulator [Deltaproteobacteria bacterium]|nr:MAG: sigma-54-dependent Fis family transcriptional regulator [Deltaproteobacteria bacterium]
MRIEDLDLHELLRADPRGGLLEFVGERALIIDAVALGLWRAEIVHSLGMDAARGIMTRFGYAHGWRVAETLREAFAWDDVHQWQLAGARFHTLQGMVRIELIEREDASAAAFAESIWHDSFEAEQHLLHHGRADQPVCWSLCGYVSGYLSRTSGREILCVERQCVGRGDPVCELVGKSKEEWGDEAAEHAAFYRREQIDDVLGSVAARLRRADARLRSHRRRLAQVAGGEVDDAGIVLHSSEMRHVVDLARRVAPVDSTVLITGESGVGKERIARLIHDSSPRMAGPFVAVNCGAISETLLESELFGHVRGAFTGATSDRAGLFEAANGGTLFLDEVGELPPAMQVKLLRALQEREVRRVGDNRSRKIDVRIVAATNRELRAAGPGAFREDLYYRLRVVEIRVPPLRERKDDILPLARYFLDNTARRLGEAVRCTGFSAQAADQLLRHDWPGNVRELENAVERAVVVATGQRVEPEDLPEEVRAARTRPIGPPRGQSLAEVEREHILAVLAAHDGNRGQTAEQLGIGSATLYRKLKRYEEEGHFHPSA